MTATERAKITAYKLIDRAAKGGLGPIADIHDWEQANRFIAAAIEAAVAEARTASAKDALRSVAPNERLSVMSEYCYYCGGPAKPNGKYCECWNDECPRTETGVTP